MITFEYDGIQVEAYSDLTEWKKTHYDLPDEEGTYEFEVSPGFAHDDTIYIYVSEDMEFDDVAATVAHELGHLTEPYIGEDETYDQQEEKALHYEYFYSDVIAITEHILETLRIEIEMHLSKN